VKICIVFDSNQFTMDHVHLFVSQSCRSQWNMSFVGDTHTNASFYVESRRYGGKCFCFAWWGLMSILKLFVTIFSVTNDNWLYHGVTRIQWYNTYTKLLSSSCVMI
jgi:hypothetical protein